MLNASHLTLQIRECAEAYRIRVNDVKGEKVKRVEVFHGKWQEYEIMHGDQRVAAIGRNGMCLIYREELLPYNLYLEPVAEEDIDGRIQNLDNFYHWCASRILTLDREYAKEILNSIGAAQSVTDRDRAEIALSYHCLSLMDIFWTKEKGEQQSFLQLNLFENHLETAFIDVSLRGRQMTIQNRHLIADDLSTHGCYPKAWIRKQDGFRLMKDGGAEPVERELLASKIARCFRVRQVEYEEDFYDGQKVSVSRIITSLNRSIVPMEYFEVYAANHDIDTREYILQLDGYTYHMMNLIDYLIGNTDRHWGNWGLFIDNADNRPVCLYDLMDFNKAFQAYDRLEGANCLTVSVKMTQKDAAIEAVKAVGLNQSKEVDMSWFTDAAVREMFAKRLALLRACETPVQ